jgi:HptB-dependent secretion and biofilm anti anti-sigma factor
MPESCTSISLTDFRATFADNKHVNYKLDFRRTTFIDSNFLGMMLILREHAGGSSDRIKLVNVHPQIKEMLETTLFDKLFDIK